MSETGPDRERLMTEAIDLVIRLQNDPDNPVAIEMARAWRARSPEHEAMWARVAKIHGASGKVLTDQRKSARAMDPAPTRRKLVIGGGLIALAALGAGYTLGPDLWIRSKADFMTGKGEIRRIALADGSIATLGPESALAVHFATAQRRIELLAGMSFFEVASDPGRPFVVASGALTATSFGTAYDVSNDAGFVTVAVDTGVVEARADGTRATLVRLEAGDWATFSPAAAMERGHRPAGQVASWRNRMIVAEHETVSALAARIGRWLPGRIVVADPFVGAQRVTGVFDLKDPQGALEAVILPTGARVRQVSPYLTLITPL